MIARQSFAGEKICRGVSVSPQFWSFLRINIHRLHSFIIMRAAGVGNGGVKSSLRAVLYVPQFVRSVIVERHAKIRAHQTVKFARLLVIFAILK
jgi:hypothetical protein